MTIPYPETDRSRRLRLILLIAIAAASVAAWQTRAGGYVLYPFTILATWFHEMGHGLAAVVVGRSFDHLVIFRDGSGYAVTMRPGDGLLITDAIVSAAGPLGPAIAGSLLILSSRNAEGSGRMLMALGAALLLSTVIWIRSLIGVVMIPTLGLSILGIAAYGRPSHRRLAVQVLGVQACISVWRQFDYLFSGGGSVGGSMRRSDTAAIADVLVLPYWFWGAALSAVIVVMLWWSLRASFRR